MTRTPSTDPTRRTAAAGRRTRRVTNPPLTRQVLRTNPRRFTVHVVGVGAAVAAVLLLDGLRSGGSGPLAGVAGVDGVDGVDAGWAR